MTLTEFLLARITEDEADARHAAEESSSPHWHWEGGTHGSVGPHPLSMACDLYADVGAHVARWDPARVLVECEAKRQILETREKLDRMLAVDDPLGIHGDGGQLYTLDWVLQRLALPYASHPDYQQEWRP